MRYSYNGQFVREYSTLNLPLVKNKGAAAWEWLHEKAVTNALTEEILEREFVPIIPRSGCACLKEWRVLLKSIPFREGDQESWAIEIHNAVNKKLGKPLWPYAG